MQVQLVCYICVHKSQSKMMTMHIKENFTTLSVQPAFDICLLTIRKVFTIRGLMKRGYRAQLLSLFSTVDSSAVTAAD